MLYHENTHFNVLKTKYWKRCTACWRNSHGKNLLDSNGYLSISYQNKGPLRQYLK